MGEMKRHKRPYPDQNLTGMNIIVNREYITCEEGITPEEAWFITNNARRWFIGDIQQPNPVGAIAMSTLVQHDDGINYLVKIGIYGQVYVRKEP